MNQKLTGVCLAFLFACLFAFNTHAQTTNNTTFGKGLRFVAADSSFSMQLGTRFQLLYQGGHDPNTKNWEDRFLIRRARLKFDGFAFSPRLVYKIELGLSNSDIGSDVPDVTNNADNIILDAVAKWALTPNLHLWVGQAKLPGNRERVISSQKLQFVDRSLLNSRFNLDRDAGLQLHHEHKVGQVVLREIGSLSMGEGRDITVNNSGGYDYTGRFEILPLGDFKGGGDYVGSDIEREQTPKLSLAASYDFNANAAREQAQLGDFLSETRDLRTWFVDAMFKYRGFSAMGEYANRKAPDGPVVLRDERGGVEETFVTGSALNLQAGYLLPSNWEVAGRYTDYTPTTETRLRAQDQYTLGISKYIVGHSLKVQSDVTLIQEAGRDDRTQFRLQMELAL
ncbi:porin [Pontibacter ramchanderi]|uniref:Phosphate-selective porin O/P n=1 Tax=Pontibacter ramchanderi TaxID=1179743 RepID=A0A2N3UBX7_9BACT|nr:porin [Pontibacter ramchanderi]PKV66845.1 phosphate-selective porin O/P [Pontibacter ramchanderi]